MRGGKKQKKKLHPYLFSSCCHISVISSEHISITAEQQDKRERKAAAGFCSGSVSVPGYSKLQIAAYNVHSYWNMFDLLTFTPPPPSLPLPLSSATSASSSYVTTPNRRKCSTSTLEAQKEEEKKKIWWKIDDSCEWGYWNYFKQQMHAAACRWKFTPRVDGMMSNRFTPWRKNPVRPSPNTRTYSNNSKK